MTVILTPKFTKFRLASIIGTYALTQPHTHAHTHTHHAFTVCATCLYRSVFMYSVWMWLSLTAGLLGTFYAAVYGIAMAKDIGPLPLEKVQ